MSTATSNQSQIYEVSGMHCGSCVNKVKAALMPLAENVEVTLTPPRAIISNSNASLATLNEALAIMGNYSLQELSNAVVASNPGATAPIALHLNRQAKPTKTPEQSLSWFKTYQPLVLIIGYLLLTTLSIQAASGHFDGSIWMTHFMAGFFLVFSFFKLLNLREFANSYAMYDLLAMRWRTYGLLYPFIELGLGLAYVLHWQHNLTNLATLIVMGFSSLGVIQAVLNKQKIRCACLGTVFNLPMSTITIIEDLLMAGMAALMLF